MMSRVSTFRNSKILHQNLYKNQQLIGNLFTSCSSPVGRSIDDLYNQYPSIWTNLDDKDIPACTYFDIKQLPNCPKKLLIDVREPNEIIETGIIPTSINIPLRFLAAILTVDCSSKEFREKYGRAKPNTNSFIIMTCFCGDRCVPAAKLIQCCGYRNVHVFKGGWLEWSQRQKGDKR